MPKTGGLKRKRRFTIPLQTNIMTIFVVIFIAFSSFIVWFNYSQNSRTALHAAERLMRDISEKVVERTEAHLQPLFSMAELSTALPAVRHKPGAIESTAEHFLLRALVRHPQILSVYVGFSDGDFFQVQSIFEGQESIRDLLGTPDESRFAIRHIRKREGTDTPVEVWRFLDRNYRQIGSSLDRQSGFDPRTRPWFKIGNNNHTVSSTDPYIFESSREIGLTVAHGFGALVPGVFGADVTLANLSEFVDQQRLGETSLLFIFDKQGNVIAHHDKKKLIRTVRQQDIIAIETAKVTDLKDPVIKLLMDMFQRKGKSERILEIFESNGKEFIAQITPMKLSSGKDWNLAFIVPIDEFIGPIVETGTWSFIISLISVGCVIPLLILAARMISRPLNELEGEAENISAFRLDDPVGVRSNIKEVQRLASTIGTAKAALQTFGRYVPKDLVRQLVQSGDVAEVGGQRRIVTIMFTDIENFTTISEDMPPEKLVHQMSEYLGALGGAIMMRNGTIDKYIGDAIMAFWNAPITDKDHAKHACLAALECLAISEKLNKTWIDCDMPPLRTRFGLHLGEAVVGNVGSSDRMNYTVIGGAVNLAARMEALNKYYGTHVLMTKDVVDNIGSKFLYRPVDRVIPKGATHPVNIFELIGIIDGQVETPSVSTVNAFDIDYCTRWGAAYHAFVSRNWSEAAECFAELHNENPNDKLAAVYSEKSVKYLVEPPRDDWDGIAVYDTK